MTRIKIEDLAEDTEITEDDLKGIRGGVFGGSLDSVRTGDMGAEGGPAWTGSARAWSLRDGMRFEFKGSY